MKSDRPADLKFVPDWTRPNRLIRSVYRRVTGTGPISDNRIIPLVCILPCYILRSFSSFFAPWPLRHHD